MSPKKITRPLDVYVRVSRVGGREGDSFISPDVQEEKCRALAKARGLEVGQVFIDLDKSGSKMDRPAFKQVLARIESGESGGVVVARIDRFARTLVGGLQAIESIEQAGGVVLTADGEFDTSTATGELVLRIMLSLAAFELRRISEQWEDAKSKARARGVHIGAARAGYVRQADGTLAEHPDHVETVKAAFALRARGGSWKEVADLLTKAGVPTSKGSAFWSRQSTRSLIQNRAYRGDPTPAWQWDKAQPQEGEPRVRGEGHVLGQGLVRCATCGQGMHKSSNGARYQILRCDTPGNGHPTISYEKARDYLLGVAFAHGVGWMVERSGGNVAEREALEQALAEARAELAVVEEMLGTEAPPDAKQKLAVEEAEAALAAFAVEPEHERFLTALGSREKFEALPVPEQRLILRTIITRAVLTPGRAHIGERLTVEFADGSTWPAPPVEVEVAA
jgi:DNA invertase Pin-like site-specific DNA recombinase